MPRQVRDANLETRAARGRLKVQHKPYFRLIEPGLHLGYRKLAAGPGMWIARRYQGDGAYAVTNLRTDDGVLVIADDYSDGDGVAVMTFAQAQNAARGKRKASGPYTVNDAVTDYLRFLESDGRSKQAIQDARYKIDAFVVPRLGTTKIAALSADRLRRWRDEIANTAPRTRTRAGEKQKHRPTDDDDGPRARRATTNRIWTILRAALNHAFRDGKVETDLAWRKVTPFRSVDVARLRYLSVAEARRLINACDPEFRPLVQAALQTGARYGELVRLQVGDFNADASTIGIRQSKSGKSRHVVLTDEGAGLFEQLAAGRASHEPLLRRADGKSFGTSQQARPMIAACERAKITPRVSFHVLRHSWASLSVMAGVPLMVVAKNLGHTTVRMVERHYGHLAPSYVADEIRKGAPRFGTIAGNVKPIRS